MTAAQIAYATQETYALEKHYYELVTLPTPVHFLFDSFARTMEKTGKNYILIPAAYSTLHVPLFFVFRIEENEVPIYHYQHIVANRKIVRSYDPQREHWPDGR